MINLKIVESLQLRYFSVSTWQTEIEAVVNNTCKKVCSLAKLYLQDEWQTQNFKILFQKMRGNHAMI